MPAKALVTGATGLLGREVVKAFEAAGYDVVGTGFKRASPPKILKVDIQDADEVQRLFNEVKLAALSTFSSSCHPPKAKTQFVPANRAQQTDNQTLFIYISTDYVFPGVQGQAPYKPTDEPRPTNVYGQTKLDGEQDNYQESAVNVLLQNLRKSQTAAGPVKMDDWAIRYPTNTADVGRVCADIAKLSEDRMTKYEISQKFAAITGLSTAGLVADKDGGKPGPDGTLRPYDCHLDTSALKELGIDVRTVDFETWWRAKLGL
ncbi:hypothetical protein DV738_g2838, partial [Chaetothyriales sp. CBS 135597]